MGNNTCEKAQGVPDTARGLPQVLWKSPVSLVAVEVR